MESSRKSGIVLIIVIFILITAFASCFKEITAPECETLKDCPPDYITCVHSYCAKYKTGCELKSTVSGDGCCSGLELERSSDEDCIIFNLNMNGEDISHPAVQEKDEFLLVNYRKNTDKKEYLAQISLKGEMLFEYQIGDSEKIFPPVLFSSNYAVSSYSQGIRIIDIEKKEEFVYLLSPASITPLCASENAVIWVDKDQKVSIYFPFENKKVTVNTEEADFLPPIFSKKHDKLFLTKKSGQISGVNINNSNSDLIEVDFDFKIGGEVSSLPSIYSDTLYIGSNNGHVYALSLLTNPPNLKWTLKVYGKVTNRILIDSKGILYVIREDGIIYFVKDKKTTGIILGTKNLFDEDFAFSPILTNKDRFLYFSPKYKAIRSILLQYKEEKISVTDGFTFSIDLSEKIEPTIVKKRLILPLKGSIAGMIIDEDLDEGVWSLPYAGYENKMSF